MTERIQKESAAREYWADALRTLACLLVVCIHVSGTGWYELDAAGTDFLAANMFDSLCRPAVPLFFMLSGAFLLRREPEPKKLLYKALRLAVLWGAASVFYVLEQQGLGIVREPKRWIVLALKGHYHLWFLRTMACLYLLLPVLRALVAYRDGKWVKWYLAVFFVFAILRETLAQVPISAAAWTDARNLFVPELCRYSGYFVLGWYLCRRVPEGLSRKKRVLCAAAYLAAAALVAAGTYLYSLGAERNDERLYSYLGLPAFVQAVSLYLLALGWKQGKLVRAAARVAPLTLGIYLFHPLMMDVLNHLGLTTGSLPRVAYIPLTAAAAFVLAAALTWLLRRIPLVCRFL